MAKDLTHFQERTVELREENAKLSLSELLKADRDAFNNGEHKPNQRWFTGIGNPALHSNFLMRMIIGTKSGVVRTICNRLLIALHSSDVDPVASIGPGLTLVHPFGLVLGRVTIGKNVQFFHNVTVGTNQSGTPTIDDDVTVFPNSIIVGGIVIGRGATIGSGSYVDYDVEPYTTVSGSRPYSEPSEGGASRDLWEDGVKDRKFKQ